MTEKRIGFLGPEGTYSQEAMEKYLGAPGIPGVSGEGEGYTAIPYNDISDILADVAAGRLDKAVAPVENSIEGSINITLDVLVSTPSLFIQGEVILPIRCHLVAKKGLKGAPVKILSHPQPLAQCQNYLKNNFPGVPRENVSSTAEAARRVAETDEKWAAVANLSAVKKYGLEVIDQDIQDFSDNATRFIVVGREMAPPSGEDKTSLAFSMAKDRPGGLYEILGEFATRGINLTKIESRPSKKGLGEYLFLVDCEGHVEDGKVREAVGRVEKLTAFFRILGSYKMARGG